jgi:hypothetical protein
MSLFWNPAGRLLCASTLLLPAGAVFSLYHARRKEMDTMVEITPSMKYALLSHAAYFLSCIFSFEVIIDQFPMTMTGSPPAQPDNLFWQMTCLSGELFFVAVVVMGAMAHQKKVPRWTLLAPLAQVSYNLKNSLIWCVLYPIFSPVGEPLQLMMVDAVSIAGFTAVYLYHYFTAPVEGKKKGE